MRILPLILSTLFLLPACQGPGGGPSPLLRLEGLVRALGVPAVNVYLVPKLKADHPQIMAFLDVDQNQSLSAEEMERLAALSPEEVGVLVLLVIDAIAEKAR